MSKEACAICQKKFRYWKWAENLEINICKSCYKEKFGKSSGKISSLLDKVFEDSYKHFLTFGFISEDVIEKICKTHVEEKEMPYKSLAQERYFNANKKKLEKQGVDVDEFNKGSKGKKLPNKVKKKKK